VRAGGKEYVASRVVLAAGLGNRDLAPLVGLEAPIRPNRGQILVTERMQQFLRRPTQLVRQTGEGTVQIGDSQEDVGMDDGTSTAQLARIADRACRLFPVLKSANVVRAWGALRVMTRDGFPIYQASVECPGAFLVTCHSGITLASNHAGAIADWIHGDAEPPLIRTFKAERFHV
jgi:glycine/D-amino acid oxidase-like deaminating enzyme